MQQQQQMMMMQQRGGMQQQQQQMTQGDHLMMAKMHRQQQTQPMRGPQVPPQQLGPGGDFLTRLERAEERDSQRDVPNFNGITLDNWEQRSRNVGRLAAHNEAAEIAAKQRLGLLPSAPQAPAAPPQQQAVPNGYSQAQRQQQQAQPPPGAPNFRQAMEQQRMREQAQQQAQMMVQRQGGARPAAAPPQAGKHYVVSIGGGYDQWDDRVPAYLAAGGGAKVLNAREARQQSRGQTSSIVFG